MLVLGTAGVAKREFMQSVQDIACDKGVQPGGRSSPLAERFLMVRDVDKMVEDEKGGYAQYGVYLGSTNQQEQEELWSAVCTKVLEEIEEKDPRHAFLLAHGVYFRNKMFRSIVDLNLIRRFRPGIILVLIDDAHDVVARIAKKEKSEGTGSKCTFAEAIEWRTVETMLGDLLSRNLFLPQSALDKIFSERSTESVQQAIGRFQNFVGDRVPCFVVARKHPPQMVYSLLFERWRLVVYASYPISSTRFIKSAVNEINRFRAKLTAEFTVFDPVTIDEYPITRKRPVAIKRWSMPGLKTNVNGIKSMTVKKFKSLETDVLRVIEARDFRMVDQSDCLVAYRPYYGARSAPASGVDREMLQSLGSGKPIFAVHDEGVDGELTPARMLFKPIARASAIRPTTQEIMVQVRQMQEEKKRKWQEKSFEPTWERSGTT